MATTNYYSQSNTAVIADGISISDFFDGDSIRVIDDSTGATKTVGLDGTSLSFGSDGSGAFEVDLKPTSPYLAIAYGMKMAQRTGNARLINITVATGAGDYIRLERCAVEKAGDVATGGPTMAKRTVRFIVSKIIWPQ